MHFRQDYPHANDVVCIVVTPGESIEEIALRLKKAIEIYPETEMC